MSRFVRRTVSIAAAPVAAFVLSAFLLPAAPASAASVACATPSLIQAISNTVSLGGAQTLDLAAGCTYTLTVVNNGADTDANGLPVISNTVALTITGNGATIVRDPDAPRFRLFEVHAGAALALTNLTLAGGYTPNGDAASNGNGGRGGAILNSGTLVIISSTLRGDATGDGSACCAAIGDGDGGAGGALFNNGGRLSLTSSTVADNRTGNGGAAGTGAGGSGGGINSLGGSLIVNASALFSNTTGNGNPSSLFGPAGLGGGIAAYSTTVEVVNSTLSGNATGDGQGISGLGGGMWVDGAGLIMHNNTLVSNTVGAFGSVGGLAVTAESGAPVVHSYNTLIAGNSGGNCGAGATSLGGAHSMSDDGTCGAGFTRKTLTQINLGPLGNNGGPTLSRALRLPSAAIDAGDNATCPATDQRGLQRPAGAGCDIGAYELQYKPAFLPLALDMH